MTTDPSGDPMSEENPLGHRVVVRYRLPPGQPQRFTDVIGVLIGWDPPTVRTADDAVITLDPAQIVALKAVGPRPVRTREIRALEAAAADGWPGVERERIDGWLASAGHGYTGRANSAVPLGDPETGGPASVLDQNVLLRLDLWYSGHSLPLRLRLPDRLAPVPPHWHVWGETRVLGVDIDNVVLPQGPAMVRVDPAPTPEWLELRRFSGEDAVDVAPPEPDEAVLTAVRDGIVGFAALGLPNPLAIGRGAVTTAPDGRIWVGLTCITVAAPHRRRGLGTLVCAELLRWGHKHGATHAYVQVEADNHAALELYRDMGFLDHHGYRYAAPTAP
ncbi:GNAT family N-acetyltransferase [Nocardia sp. alder85J]|uniref:N-acetylglutamate synthase, CG3035 family n=1 Tax=Nocardia sp. alder85J TaxID=2862949 RepID=UPI001CD52A16|nr:GNAT family N-acetyltransferase [Nocardia sp. alder85J]MCX4098981.1 GNAT family N-acetyltransferase [Nocardia sp. alder85J]